jgi:ureidoacrylate peracid hydrolase
MATARQAVQVEAQPEPLSIDPATTAVLVVDMQNDFGAEGGMFHRAGIDVAPIRAAIVPTARVLAAARSAGIPVVYLTMGHRADLSDAGAGDSPHRRKHAPLGVGAMVTAPDGRESRVLVRDTWNTEILPELAPEAGDIIVPKHRYSGFYETDLDSILRSRGVITLIVTGCTTSVCVESTIRDAMFRDYTCLLLTDCTAEPIGAELPRSNHDASLLVIRRLFGWTATSEALLAALEAEVLTAAD